MIVFACASCGKKLQVQDRCAGQKGKCPGCGQAVRVPSAPPRPPKRAAADLQPHTVIAARVEVPVAEPIPRALPLQAAPPVAYDFLTPPEAADELGRLGPYRILGVLGTGGMGIVFEAEDLQLKRRVALKVMPPVLAVSATARQRFLREAQATAAIEHEHIVAIHQVGEERGLPYLAMQLLKGEPLHDRLQREPRLPVVEVLRIGREIAQGLAAAHDRGLIHRDIKPANIWLEAGGHRVKILDFGLARTVEDDAQVTQTGRIVGTPAYMAPEQTRSQPIDPRCDLFSLGTLLYRLCTGRQPFLADDTIATLLAVATEQPAPPHELNPEVPAALSDLVMRLLAKHPNDRPSSARAVVEAIEAIESQPAPTADGLAALTLPSTRLRRRQRQSPRGRYWALAVGGAGLLAVMAWLIASGLTSRTPSKTNPVPHPQPRSDAEPVAKSPPPAPAKTPAGDPGRADRHAAEWVLQLGGRVDLTPLEGGPATEVTRVAALPSRSFWVQRIRLEENKQVTDAGLENIKGLARLQALWLPETRISDAGLIHLKGLRSLQGLNLAQTAVSDRGLVNLRELKELQALYLDGTGVNDAGLKQLKDLTQLRELSLRWTQVSDAGLEHLRGLTSLQVLSLLDTRVSDAGLDHLTRLTDLRSLRLKGTQVTEAGARRLQAALPHCQVQY